MPLAQDHQTSRAPELKDDAHHFTKEEYRSLHRAGVFGDRKTELLNGQIYDMAPQNDPHALAISRLNVAFIRQLDLDAYWIRSQATYETASGLPEPDVAIVEGKDEKLVDAPKKLVLVIEVADTSLQKDLGEKVRAYATEKYPEYWVFDVNAATLHVFKKPDGAGSYTDHRVLTSDEMVSPEFAPNVAVAVKFILPLGAQSSR